MADEVAASLDDLPSSLASEGIAPEPKVEAPKPGIPEDDVWSPSAKARIEELKKEAQTNRERAQEYEKLYGQNSELQQFHAAAKAYADGDIDTTQAWLLDNAAAVLGITKDELVEKFTEPEDEDDKPLTRREWKELQKAEGERARASLQAEQVGEIQSHAKSLGYEVGSRLYNDLLWVAMNETGNDLDKAHEIVSNTPQQYINEYVKGQREKARGGLRPASGSAPGTAREITTWKDADAAAEEFLNSRI